MAKLLGHPIHPMLIVFPLGLLSTSVIFDILARLAGNPLWSVVAYYMIIAGIIGGLVAAVPGFLDWLGVPADTRARRIGLVHGAGNVVMLVLFVASWLVRRPDPAALNGVAFALSLAGLAIALLTGWLGGELVNRLGIGVEPGAHPDAPSSLSGEPAHRPTPARQRRAS
jgi:uncharacterized membrane protein